MSNGSVLSQHHDHWPFLPDPDDVPDYAPPTKEDTATKRELRAFYGEIVLHLHHEDGLLNSRLEGFLVASGLLAAVYTQLLAPSLALAAAILAAVGAALSAVFLNVLQRTCATVAWYMEVLLRLEVALKNDTLRPQWTRRYWKRDVTRRVASARWPVPVSVIIGYYIPLGAIMFWVLLLAFAVWRLQMPSS